MLIRLPPLNSLRVFEVVSRTRSFSRAAEILFVTPAAVNHQIRLLEDLVGEKLFIRAKDQLHLTSRAVELLPSVTEAFALLEGAFVNRRPTKRQMETVRLAVSPALGERWLMPRLSRFSAEHADIDLSVKLCTSRSILANEDFDVAVVYGALIGKAFGLDHLVSARYVPVCSPGSKQKNGGPFSAERLAEEPLIYDETSRLLPHAPTWENWFSYHDISLLAGGQRIMANSALKSIDAAISGAGHALVQDILVHDDLKQGRLVQSMDETLEAELSYFVIEKNGRLAQSTAVVREWLHGMATEYTQSLTQ
jgi:LysR family glycine cleavage system transcriptional activator